jgi:O-methyltransferase involved in polyketide biosynthesis
MATQRPSTWLAMRCRESLFQAFLGAANEEEAAEVVRIICGVDSRAQIDTNTEAQKLWHDVIRKPYIEFLEKNHGTSRV